VTEHSIQPGSTITGPTLPEPVYSDFLRLPRIRFLPADDLAARKTIMAGLLLKEPKARGLVRRVSIVAPASLTFQWQREVSDTFREKFEVIRGDVLRAVVQCVLPYCSIVFGVVRQHQLVQRKSVWLVGYLRQLLPV
jgi:hypothetical protein